MLPTIATLFLALALLLLILRAEGDETIGSGSIVEINDGAADAYVAIPKVETLGIPTEKTNTTESKALDLPNQVIQKLPALKDGGSFTIKYHVLAETWDRIETIRQARATKKWRVKAVCDTGFITIVVPGFIESNAFEDIEAEKLNIATATVVVSGAQESNGGP